MELILIKPAPVTVPRLLPVIMPKSSVAFDWIKVDVTVLATTVFVTILLLITKAASAAPGTAGPTEVIPVGSVVQIKGLLQSPLVKV